MATIDDAPEGFSPKRVEVLAAVISIVGGLAYGLFRHSFSGGLSLTAAGAVAIINFRWLEVVLMRVVQPGAPQFDGGSALRLLGRMALFGVLMAAMLWVPNIDAIGVALGFSALVIALIVEAFRWGRDGGG
jgi:hypothetical protein